ncbi:hypothetical protein [Terriglobus aquaticus]|uniref:SPOR domain-containing protein n=1 Tax=Terriglobus aquaticus TaxID=940139 RepID=A0ABW9KHD6_9BACT|nr:hypothetical protein [Terriglobus aquaticus]
MHLWTEYEGNTLAGYPVGRLSRSEGRSAFFLTVAEGQPALLRLTESHFDEGELIGRWEKAAAVSHPGLQAVRKWGQTTFDGVPLAFCVLEPNDASLSDVLRERVLTSEEAGEVAEAVAGALAALHRASLIHGHVDAINVFAVGEAVKLRSDCVRECTGDFEADTEEAREALRQRDVHDLGLLLRRCLTPQWEESAAMQLPSPFDRIVRRALNGTVDAAGIVEEMELLKPVKPAETVTRPPVPTAPATTPVVAATAATPVRGTAVRTSEPAPAAPAAAATSGRRIASAPPRVTVSGANSPAAVSAMLAGREPLVGGRSVRAMEGQDHGGGGSRGSDTRPAAGDTSRLASLNLPLNGVRDRSRQNVGMAERGGLLQGLGSLQKKVAGRKVWVASGAIVAVVGFVLWSTVGGSHHASPVPASPTQPVVAAAPAGAQSAPSLPAGPAAHAPAGQHAAPVQTSLFTSGERAGWYVIAYTYRYEKQAEAKAMQLKDRYTGMQPQVYSPTGHAPYFVALGGPSDSVQAFALRDRARRAGLPRDTYARNF